MTPSASAAEADPNVPVEQAAPPCVMSFNVSDPSGAGGSAGDVATIAAMGAHALPVVTSIVMRDTAEVFDHHAIDADVIVEQARSVLEDVTIAAWKVGFLGSTEGVSAVAEILSDYPDVPLVAYLPNLSWVEEDEQQAYLEAFRDLVLPQTEVLVGSHQTLTDFLLPSGRASGRPRRARSPSPRTSTARATCSSPACRCPTSSWTTCSPRRRAPSPARSSSASRRPSSAPARRSRRRSPRCWRPAPSCTPPSARRSPSSTRRSTRGSGPAWATSFPTASSGPCREDEEAAGEEAPGAADRRRRGGADQSPRHVH